MPARAPLSGMPYFPTKPIRANASFTLESAYGFVKPIRRPENFKEIARIAKDEKAERSVRELLQE